MHARARTYPRCIVNLAKFERVHAVNQWMNQNQTGQTGGCVILMHSHTVSVLGCRSVTSVCMYKDSARACVWGRGCVNTHTHTHTQRERERERERESAMCLREWTAQPLFGAIWKP